MKSDMHRFLSGQAWADSLKALNTLPVSADADRFLDPDDAAERIRRAAAEHPGLVRLAASARARKAARSTALCWGEGICMSA